jgi:ligand-binding sensor domain-containing protein/signal transduction histidine kinase
MMATFHSVRALIILLPVTILFLAGAVQATETGSASQGLSFHRWGHEDGLPDDTVTALLQTQDGYLWVGTAKGLARFDGVEFDSMAFPEQGAVTSLCEDDSHRLWIGTHQSGLFWESGGKVHRFTATEHTGQSITSFAVDGADELWVGTTSGLFRVALSNLTLAQPSLGFTNELISGVHAARSGTIWITTRNGMSQYKNGKVTPVEFPTESLGRNPEFIGMYEDRNGNLWAFGDTYLVNLNEGKRFNYFRTGDASSFRIWTLREGRGGQLWIGTSGQGLFSFADGKFRPLALRENRLPSDVRAICEDREGDLWLGTFGGGLIRLRVRREQVFDAASGLPDETATCIAVSEEGRLWAGFSRGGLFAASGQHFERIGSERLISSLCLTPEGSAWVGTRGNGLVQMNGTQEVQFTTDSGLASDVVSAVAAQADGAILAGTSAGTVHRLNQGRWETFGKTEGLSGAAISSLLVGQAGTTWVGTVTGEVFRLVKSGFRPITASDLTGAEVCAMAEDADGRLWIGTAGRGLAHWQTNHLTVWDMKSGFPDNDVFGVLPDTNGILWVATSKGIFRVETRFDKDAASPFVARLILESDAPSTEMAGKGFPQAVRSSDGRLWFVMPGRVVALDPHEVEINPTPFPVYIEEVLANDRRLELSPDSKPLRLPSRLTSLEIRFAALNLAEPEKVRFQYKLDGFDNGWIEGSASRRVRYGRLPYGNYTFHSRARNADGVWSDAQAQLSFTYPAPPWRSPEAIALYVLAATGLVVMVVRTVSHRRLRLKLERLAHQQAMEKERMRIAQDMHDEVGSKLTKISYLSEIMAMRGGATQVESLQSIASTSRDLLQALDEIVWAVNPRNDSLERLAAYLGHYATEYLQNTPLELEIDLPDGLPDHPLSAEMRHNLFLAFEEALGNALRHSGATKIQVAMKIARPSFTITIIDNGHGFDFEKMLTSATGRDGNGLVNMRQRLSDIGGNCQISSVPGKGTTVVLGIKLSVTAQKYA